MKQTIRFLRRHPLTRARPVRSALRVARWQVLSRLRDEVIIDWLDDARLAVRRGMTGATGNVYAGLHEFADMAFIIHLLRPGDLFLDIGANVGTYSVLAGKVCGTNVIAVEPDPETQKALRRNLQLNDLDSQVRIEGVAVGAEPDVVHFTIGLDTTNKVVKNPSSDGYREVRQMRLDDLVGACTPTMLKLDVEGYEREVFKGASGVLANPGLLAIETELDDPEVNAVLEGAGFQRTYYEPFSRQFTTEPKSLASNALYVRDPQVCLHRCASAPRRKVIGREF
ncbi:FkbM family methyltransferase [Thalassovita mediterranea]|nr:FkbM family methyltransferase [Thalassovita mediterranea]